MHIQKKTYNNFFKYFNDNLHKVINEYIHPEQDNIKEYIFYSLNGGKRLRPILILSICNTLTNNAERGLKLAIAVELIHSVSLMIDDLPCMDNDTQRRGKDCFHIKYSEIDTNIVSSIMINLAIKLINDNFNEYKMDDNIIYVIKNISYNLGILGLTGGQAMDLSPLDDQVKFKKDKKNIELLFHMKTTSLFQVCFISAYLICKKYDQNSFNLLTDTSKNFGLCFQIYDDFEDIEQDKTRIDKNLIDPNYINNFGIHESNKVFNKNMNEFLNNMKNLNLLSNEIIEISNKLLNKLK